MSRAQVSVQKLLIHYLQTGHVSVFIFLDSCRCELANLIGAILGSNIVKCISSQASSTMEFWRKFLLLANTIGLHKLLKNVVFINTNPVIDYILKDYLSMFKLYTPLWTKSFPTHPREVVIEFLRLFLKYGEKVKYLIWFLQPHLPFVRFENAIKLVEKQDMYPRGLTGAFDRLSVYGRILYLLLKRRALCAGIPVKACIAYMRFTDMMYRAYVDNLMLALRYIRFVKSTVGGTIVVTSDHGEAFGERLLRLIPVYGHPTRIPINALRLVPLVLVQGEGRADKALRLLIRLEIEREASRSE